jgi:sulfide:quinone oxidoreductase
VAFAERGISWHPGRLVKGLDPRRKVVSFSDGTEMRYDLFLGVPLHKVPTVIENAGLTTNGWVPVNPLTLETAFCGRLCRGRRDERGYPDSGSLL